MAAPPEPAPFPEIADLEVEADALEGRTLSHTLRFGSNASNAATAEIDLRPGPANGNVENTGKTARPYLPGDVIQGKYRLTRIIGRGGMGAVWLAHNVPLDIEVAIKLIRRDRTAPGAADRLLTEARAAARLMHPAIVRVFDFGETEQHDPFIVMELLRGESLHAILRRKKRLSPEVAVQMMLPVAAALSSAHGKGIVHRDLKPDNIIVVTDESGALVPKIVDFGIAKLMTPGVEHHVTLAGEVLGSPDYMSPEQARGASDVGEPTDVWTFSVVLYELIAGKRPFDGPNYNALLAAIITSPALPLTAHGVGDAALADIIARGLAKDIAARWPTMREVGAALAAWAVAHGLEDDVMGSPIGKQWLAGGARRILTVQPETGEAPLRSGLVTPSSQPGGAAPRIARETIRDRAAMSLESRRASARNAIALVLGIVVLGIASTAVFLVRAHGGAEGEGAAASRAPVASAPPTPRPTAQSAPPAPSGSPAPASAAPEFAPAPIASSGPEIVAPAVPTSSAHGPLHARKPYAPPAPKNIQF